MSRKKSSPKPLAFQPGMTRRGAKYRVVTFTLAFRLEEPASVDMEQWRAQLFDVLNTAMQCGEIPDEELIIGYDPKEY